MRDEKLLLKDDSVMRLTHFLKNGAKCSDFFKLLARYSIIHYVGRSVRLLVCPFISASTALLVGDTFFRIYK